MKQVLRTVIALVAVLCGQLLFTGCRECPKCPSETGKPSYTGTQKKTARGPNAAAPNSCDASPVCATGQTCGDAPCRTKIEDNHKVTDTTLFESWINTATNKRQNKLTQSQMLAVIQDASHNYYDCCSYTVKISYTDLAPQPLPQSGAPVLPRYYNMALFREIIEKVQPDSFVFFTALKDGLDNVVFKTYKGGKVQGLYDLSSGQPPSTVQ